MKTVKIKINKRTYSDVTEMIAKGWKVSVFRDVEFKDEFVVITKDRLKFHIHVDAETKSVLIDRYIDGKKLDCKRVFDSGSGINGNVVIVEGDTAEQTYALFRTDDILALTEKFGIRRVVFAKQPGTHFNTTFPKKSTQIPDFNTDGTIADKGNVYEVTNATYLYDYENLILTISQTYDIEALHRIMDAEDFVD